MFYLLNHNSGKITSHPSIEDIIDTRLFIRIERSTRKAKMTTDGHNGEVEFIEVIIEEVGAKGSVKLKHSYSDNYGYPDIKRDVVRNHLRDCAKVLGYTILKTW